MKCLTFWFLWLALALAAVWPLGAAFSQDLGQDLGQRAGDPNGDLVGSIGLHRVEDGETLLDIAVLHHLGYVELRLANPGLDPWLPKVGALVLLPTRRLLPPEPRRGIVINLTERRLYHFAPNGGVSIFPIGIGDRETVTPLGTTRVVRKRKDPIWRPPASIRQENPALPAQVLPGPDNPLGPFALDLGWPSYLIHGTNSPFSIGRAGTHGCVRLYNPDIERLYRAVKVGTPVVVGNTRFKVGMSGRRAYLEVHPDTEIVERVEAESGWTNLNGEGTTGRMELEPFGFDPLEFEIRDALTALVPEATVNWFAVSRAITRRQGFAVPVSTPVVPALSGPNRPGLVEVP
jgi:L,D-transpeptidase ErfK/SrfK